MSIYSVDTTGLGRVTEGATSCKKWLYLLKWIANSKFVTEEQLTLLSL